MAHKQRYKIWNNNNNKNQATDQQHKPIVWPPHDKSLHQKTFPNRQSVRKFPSAKDRTTQKPAMQTNWAVSTQHEPPPKGISEHTLVLIVSKYSSPKNEPDLAVIYTIKLQYKQKLINVRTHNVKRFLGNLTQNMPWFYISAFNILPLKVPIKVLIKVPKKVPIKVIETSSNNRTCPEVLKWLKRCCCMQ